MEYTIDEIYKASATQLFGLTRQALDKEQDVLGLDLPMILQLAQLDSWSQDFLAQKASQFMSLSIDSQALNQLLTHCHQMREVRELENTFLSQKATQAMMHELFGMHANLFSWRRRLLGFYGEDRHRPQVCDAKTEQCIWRHWHDSEGMEVRLRYLKVVALSDQPLRIVWAAVRNYYKEKLPDDNHEKSQ